MDRGFWNYPQKDENDLYMIHCGIKQNEPGELCGPAIREMYLLHFVLKGKGTYFVSGEEYHLGAGDVFAIYPEDLVSYQADTSEPWLFCWIGFHGKNANLCYEKIGISRQHLVTHLHNHDFANSISRALDYIDSNKNNLSQLRLTAFVYEILSTLEKTEIPSKDKKEIFYINKSLQYIEYNLHKKIFVSDIAEHIGLEHSYFYRIFKNNLGVSPEKYLMQQRIEKAKKYIAAGADYKDIPVMVGISNIYYLYRVFKNITGMTPSQYKKQHCHPVSASKSNPRDSKDDVRFDS